MGCKRGGREWCVRGLGREWCVRGEGERGGGREGREWCVRRE